MIRSSLHSIFLSALVLCLVNSASVSMAGPPAIVPEISPAAATSAIAVLASSGLILAERLRARRK